MPPPVSQSQALGTFAKHFLGEIAKAFGKCSHATCAKRSIGWICGSCGHFVCNAHGYLTLEVKPQVVCAACIAAMEG